MDYDPDKLIKLVNEFPDFRPSQKDGEIKRLMEIIRERNLKNICEIGSYKGGSLFLISQAAGKGAKLISIDVNYPMERQILNKQLVKPKQHVVTIKGDTRMNKTFLKVKRTFNEEPLDLLFIDGDHSIEGVKDDFEQYSQLVRKGGVIVFHDIHPDSYILSGKQTSSYVGDVPIFWQQLKKDDPDSKEIIENVHQDGYGMGIVINN